MSLIDELTEDGIVIPRHEEPLAHLMSMWRGEEGQYVMGPTVVGKSGPGPLCPKDENPYDLLFD